MTINRPLTLSESQALKTTTAAADLITEAGKVNAWMRLFSKVDTILLGRRIPVEADEGIPAAIPAMCNGKEIKFSQEWVQTKVIRQLQFRAKQVVAMLKGINYHELGHAIFSPDRDASPFATSLARACNNDPLIGVESVVWLTGNLLEDQRMENLFVAMYPGSKPYLRASTLHGIIEGTKDGQPRDGLTLFIFTYGRRFLQRQLRATYRADAEKIVGAQWCQDWADMIDEFTTLNLVNDTDRAAELICEAHHLLVQVGFIPPPSDHPGRPGVKRDSSRAPIDERKSIEAAEKAEAEQEADKAEAAKDDKAGSDPASGDEEDGDDEATDSDKAGKGDDESEEDGDEPDDADSENSGTSEPDDEDTDDGDDEADADGAGSDDDTDDDADDDADDADGGDGDGEGDEGDDGEPGDADSDEDGGDDSDAADHGTSDSSSGSGAGYNDSQDTSTEDDEPRMDLQDALDDLMSDRVFDREVTSLIDEYRREAERGDIEKPRKSRRGMPERLRSEERGIANRLYKVLYQMRADAGGSWERMTATGKLNVMDFATRNPWDLDVFTTREDGREEEFNMEVVILLDLSPSMGGMERRASLALWQIKSAMQRLDVPVTVYGYNDNRAACLMAPSDAVTDESMEVFDAGGSGTDPLDALTRAFNILSRSPANKKLLVTITDGEWNPGTRWQSDALVEKINRLGAETILVGLTSYAGKLIDSGDRSTLHMHRIGREVNDPVHILDVFKDYVYKIGHSSANR